MSPPSPELFRRARARFEELVEEPEAERAARLAALAEADPELAAAVRGLLAADAGAGAFLERPAVPLAVKAWLAAAGEEAAALGQEIGPYRTVALLGRGGMGEVYLAERADGQFEQRVALKVLRRGLDSDEILRRFLRERQLLARLEHPNVARLLDGGRAPDGRPFIVMERVEGEPITQWCAARGAPVEERLRLAVTCCEAVAAAHRNLIVHRDLKPSNILVGADGVKLLDFGIAKLLGEDGEETLLTRAGVQVLTPAYAAPEQILGGPITTATDVYALGVLLYELLTGALPHDRRAATAAELSAKVSRETVERPSAAARRALAAETEPADREGRRRARRLQGDLDLIVLKALHRDPARRYASAAALADDLRRHLGGQPVSARPDTLGYRAVKLVERHRVGAAAAVLVALSLVGGLAGALWQWRRAEAQARLAEAQARRGERVKAFLVSVLREADPLRRDRARELTAGELLQRAVSRLDAELREEPAVRAQLMNDFALVYLNRGDPGRALPLARRALALRRRLAPASSEVAESLETLSDLLANRRDYPGAEAAAREALAIEERRHGKDSLEAAEAAERLMIVFHHLERFDEALALSRRVLEAQTRFLGPDHPDTALQTMNLGSFLVETGRLAEGEAVLRDAVRRLTAAHGPGHTKVGIALQNLAETVQRRGRPREALPLIERAVAILDRQLGGAHPLAAAAREQLAQTRAAAAPRSPG